MEEARHTAMQRMIEDAKKLGERLLIGMRLCNCSKTMRGAAEIIAYGTAVKTF